MTVNPQERLAVVLDAATWNVVINLLSIAPQSLIAEITRQCQMHEMKIRAAQPMPMQAPEDYGPLAVRGNGEARVD